MGQAKQRGTFWQRRSEAEARRVEERLRLREEEAAREAAMTPEEKEARRKALEFLTMTTALMVGMTANAEIKRGAEE